MTGFRVVDNPTPNNREHRIARQIADALGYWGSVEHDPVNVAGMLALVREGYSLDGPRVVVSGDAQIPTRHPDLELNIPSATEYAWRSWFAELRRQRLRPCGWPAETRTYLAHAPGLNSGPVELVEVDPDDPRAELLTISVSCEAVPIA